MIWGSLFKMIDSVARGAGAVVKGARMAEEALRGVRPTEPPGPPLTSADVTYQQAQIRAATQHLPKPPRPPSVPPPGPASPRAADDEHDAAPDSWKPGEEIPPPPPQKS